MTQRGENFGEGPTACPFVALELDRDRRSDKPDYRHRCFAEPTPQPRALAHQEAYCLSADFAACPIFQGWALRAAARPVPAPSDHDGRGSGASPGAPAVVDPAIAGAAALAAATQQPLPPDVAPIVPAEGEPWPSDAFTAPEPADAPRQLEAFDAAAQPSAGSVETGASADMPPLAPSLPPLEPAVPAARSSASPPSETPAEAPVPDFLAGRREREPLVRPRASRPDVQFREKVTREEIIPSWDLTSRYGAQAIDDRGGGGGDRFGGLVTAVAVVAILALGVAGVIFLPGLLAGGGGAKTPTPAITAPATGLPSAFPTADASLTPSSGPTASPGVTPVPTATPLVYRVKPGDSLLRIAHKFHVSLDDLLAANPQITNPDSIQPGQLIVIPQPTPTPTVTATPSASP